MRCEASQLAVSCPLQFERFHLRVNACNSSERRVARPMRRR